MSLTIEPIAAIGATHLIRSTHRIMLAGTQVGELFHRAYIAYGSPFHAVLYLYRAGCAPAGMTGLAQGHGKTAEEAIRDALTSSRERASDYLAKLSEMESRMLTALDERMKGGQQ